MRQITSFVKQWLIPGTLPALMLAVTVGVLLLNAGPVPLSIGRAWMTLMLLLYWCLSLPAVSSAIIARSAGRFGTVRTGADARGARVLVAVGNGSVHYSDGARAVDYLTRRSVFCVFEAARVYMSIRPEVVIVTGGSAGEPNRTPEAVLMRDLLVRLDVPGERIRVESRSLNTQEQVDNVAAMIRAHGEAGPVIVVTTSAHMPRVAALFDASHVEVVGSVTPELRYDGGAAGWRRWRPSMAALTGSTSALYELLARVHNRAVRTRYARRQNKV
jgi:uncharacterized SAM-binding protein YcdF (DUF218 family)